MRRTAQAPAAFKQLLDARTSPSSTSQAPVEKRGDLAAAGVGKARGPIDGIGTLNGAVNKYINQTITTAAGEMDNQGACSCRRFCAQSGSGCRGGCSRQRELPRSREPNELRAAIGGKPDDDEDSRSCRHYEAADEWLTPQGARMTQQKARHVPFFSMKRWIYPHAPAHLRRLHAGLAGHAEGIVRQLGSAGL